MKNLGYAGVALGALLSTTDLYGHRALDVLETVKVEVSQADIADAQKKWEENVDDKFNNTQSLLIDTTAEQGIIHWRYLGVWYYCSLNGALNKWENGQWALESTNVCSEEYRSWSHLNLNMGVDQIGLWVLFDEDGTSKVVVDSVNLKVRCGIKGDAVVMLGDIRADGGLAVLSKNYFANFAWIASPWFCVCTHYGSNYNYIGDVGITGNSINALYEAERFFDDHRETNLFGNRGFNNYGTIVAEKAETCNLNYNDHGNTDIKELIQNGDERNIYVSRVKWLTKTLIVKIHHLLGTQTLRIPGGKHLGDNTYGYEDGTVWIKIGSNVDFNGNFECGNINPQNDQPHNDVDFHQQADQSHDEAPDNVDETTQNVDDQQDEKNEKSDKRKPKGKNDKKTGKNKKKRQLSKREMDKKRFQQQARRQKLNKKQSNYDNNENQNNEQQVVDDQQDDNDNEDQNNQQQPPADQSNTDKDVADRISHPANFLDLIKQGVLLRPINGDHPGQKSKEEIEQEHEKNRNPDIFTKSMINKAMKERRGQVESRESSDDEKESSSSSSFDDD